MINTLKVFSVCIWTKTKEYCEETGRKVCKPWEHYYYWLTFYLVSIHCGYWLALWVIIRTESDEVCTLNWHPGSLHLVCLRVLVYLLNWRCGQHLTLSGFLGTHSLSCLSAGKSRHFYSSIDQGGWCECGYLNGKIVFDYKHNRNTTVGVYSEFGDRVGQTFLKELWIMFLSDIWLWQLWSKSSEGLHLQVE